MEQSTLARDKISQAYLELWGDEATQERAKNRIDWLAVNANGPKILDIGCSEGILPILLGREGNQVLGIDVNLEALSYAHELLKKEDETVKNNVLFQQENILAANDYEEEFDTVIIAEVIEHLFHPHKAVQKAVQRLKPDGLLLLTTPFGYFPDPDHHQTFTLTDVVNIVKQYCAVEHISIVDGYIRISGKKQDSLKTIDDTISIERILHITERAAIDAQKSLRANYNASVAIKAKEIQSINQKHQEINQRNLELYQKNQELYQKNQELYQKNQELYQKNQTLGQQTQKQDEEIRKLKEQIQTVQQKLRQETTSKKHIIKKLTDIKNSESWKVGYVTVKAFTQPGKNTLLWLPRLFKILYTSLKKIANKSNSSTKVSHSSDVRTNQSKPGQFKQWSVNLEQLKKEYSIAGWDNILDQSEFRLFTVADNFTRLCFQPECNMILPRPDNWQALAEYWHPNILLVESAWKGNEGSWQYRVGQYANPPGQELKEMVAWFRYHGIPTIFWNKEDPVHYDQFIDAARFFDIILTTDVNCIPNYLKDIGNDKIHALSFAAQPKLHNPIYPGVTRKEKACFAGSFYSNRFPERRQEMEWLLDAASNVGLEIYDRNFGLTGTGSQDFIFPDRFQKHIIGRVPYPELCHIYKQYKIFLNVNSVIDSPTMFSRRVYELLAAGTPVVSTYSEGIEKFFGRDIVWLVNNKADAQAALETLLNDPDEWQARSLKGIRSVFSNHTYSHRLQEIITHAGVNIPTEKTDTNPQILLVSFVANQQEFKRLINFAERQTFSQFRLFLLTEKGSSFTWKGDDKRINILHVEKQAEWLSDTLKKTNSSHFGLLTPNTLYGKFYLEDLANAFKYSTASIIGKPMFENAFEYDVPLAADGFLVKIKDLVEMRGCRDYDLHLDIEKLSHIGLRRFCIDSRNYMQDIDTSINTEKLSTFYKKIDI